jgi:hypothetical protein
VDGHPRNHASPPPWLEAVGRFERLIGVPVERLVTSDAYFGVLSKLRRIQAQMTDRVAAWTDDWYRLMNVPTGSDVRRIRRQLSRMERRLETLTKELADRDQSGEPARPT